MNWQSVLAIYRFEMARTFRTLMQSVISPVLSTVLSWIRCPSLACLLRGSKPAYGTTGWLYLQHETSAPSGRLCAATTQPVVTLWTWKSQELN